MTSTSTHGMRSTGGDADLMRQAQAKALHMQNGGPVNGPGTSTSDSIPAKLSKGEYVIPAHIVAQKGTDFFDKMIDPETKKPGGMKAPVVNGEAHAADGGFVDGFARTPTQRVLGPNLSPEATAYNASRVPPAPVRSGPISPGASPTGVPFTQPPGGMTGADMWTGAKNLGGNTMRGMVSAGALSTQLVDPVMNSPEVKAQREAAIAGLREKAGIDPSAHMYGGTAATTAAPVAPVATPFAMGHTVRPTEPTLAQMAGSQTTPATWDGGLVGNTVMKQQSDDILRAFQPSIKEQGGFVMSHTVRPTEPTLAQMAGSQTTPATGGLVGNTIMNQQSDDILRAFQPSIKEQGGFNIGRGTATPVATPVATPANRLDLGGGNYIQGKMAPGADVEHMRSLMAPSTPEAAAGRAASEAEVDKRRAATAAWDRANPQAPAGGMSYQQQVAPQQTDYTGAINQLLDQASTKGDSGSFDSMIAAKHQRQAAQQGLQTLSGMRSADLSNQQGYARMASEQGMKQQDLAAAQANREAERGIAAGTAAQAQADRDRAFGLSYDTAAESQRHAGAMEAGQAEDRAFRVGQQQSSDAKALQEEKARRAKIAGAAGYAEAQEGATFDPKTGTYSKPGFLYGTNPLDAAATSRIQAVKSGQEIADVYGRLKSR